MFTEEQIKAIEETYSELPEGKVKYIFDVLLDAIEDLNERNDYLETEVDNLTTRLGGDFRYNDYYLS